MSILCIVLLVGLLIGGIAGFVWLKNLVIPMPW